jgi:dissimilatory sulfite reductase (desulfoviridin) alpha/beta subunit
MAVEYKALKSGGFMRQSEKDYFSVRLKVVGGHLLAGDLKAIAEAAETFGQGVAHLTSRQGVEIPHIHLRDVESLKGFLAGRGVLTGVCGARVRTVTACQGRRICPSGCVDTLAVARAISERYYGRELPHKFKFGVTGCQNNCLKAEENDVGVKGGLLVEWREDECVFCGVCAKACREGAIAVSESRVAIDRSKCNHCGRCVKSCPTDAWAGTPGYILSFGGLFGNRVAIGRELLPLVSDLDALCRCTDAALDFFQAHGKAGERFRLAVERRGWEALADALRKAVDGDPKAKAKDKAGAKAKAKASLRPKGAVKPEAKAETRLDPKLEPKAGAKAEIKLDEKLKSKAKSEIKLGEKQGAKLKAKAKADVKLDETLKSKARSETKLDEKLKSKAKAETKLETKPKAPPRP